MDGGTPTAQPHALTGDPTKNTEKEAAAHEKRNWVRLTFDCNDRCVFCLDAHTHDGTNRDRQEVKQQILDGRRKGADRLILSGGEPTIHPNYVDFIKLGRKAGYRKIQTVTNGRLFSYREFLTRCIDAGLGEITFSIHGVNARIHDALVGSKGAFDQEIQGLQNALEDGRVIINIDVCVNRGNVKTLPDLLEKFTAMGVREYDLLHVIPFGRAYTEGKETLFYDLEEMRPYLLAAFEYSKRPDMHIWLNRFPVQHLEGFENLIQDPYKLNDEIRGRKEEYELLLDAGVPLDCRAPHRCAHCYLEPVCDTLEEVRATVEHSKFAVVRYDTEWDGHLAPVYGGDPASAERSQTRRKLVELLAQAEADGNQVTAESAAAAIGDPSEATHPGRGLDKIHHRKLHLPLLGGGFGYAAPTYRPIPEQITRAGATALWLVAPSLEHVSQSALDPFDPTTEIELALDDYSGLAESLDDRGQLFGKRLTRVIVKTRADAEAMLALPHEFEVCVELAKSVEPWLLGLETVPARLALRQPSHELMSDSAERDVDLTEFFRRFTHAVPVDDVPSCVIGRPARARREQLDAGMLTADGKLEIFRYIKRYILDRYWSKSLRCKTCVYTADCRGMHISYIRAHGFGLMRPVELSSRSGSRPELSSEVG